MAILAKGVVVLKDKRVDGYRLLLAGPEKDCANRRAGSINALTRYHSKEVQCAEVS